MLIQATAAAPQRARIFMYVYEMYTFISFQPIPSRNVLHFECTQSHSYSTQNDSVSYTVFFFGRFVKPIYTIWALIVCTVENSLPMEIAWKVSEWENESEENVRILLARYKFYGIFIPKLLQYVTIIYVVVCVFKKRKEAVCVGCSRVEYN